MDKKKILSLLMAGLLTFGFVFVSCSGNDGRDESNTSSQVTETEDNIHEKDNIPSDLKFDGTTVVIHVRDDDDVIRDIFVEDTSTQINQALYNKNLKVENRLGVKIEAYPSRPWQKYTEAIEGLGASIEAGDGAYDIVAGWSSQIPGLGTSNYFENLNTVPYVELSKPWWNDSLTEAISIHDVILFAAGDVSLSSISYSYCYLVNKNFAKDYEAPDMLQLVEDGKWTLDKLTEITRNDFIDENGDGEKDFDDKYWLESGATNAMDGFLNSCGIVMFERDEDGIPVYVPEVEKLTEINQKLYDILYVNNGTYYISENDYEGTAELFMEDRAFLVPCSLVQVETTYFKMNGDYEIIPYPKYDEFQKEYKTYVQDGVALWCVPTDVKDKNVSGAVLEALASESYRSVTETYFEVVMKGRYARDDSDLQSKMLDYIRDGQYYSFAQIYNGKIARPWHCLRVNLENYIASYPSWAAAYGENVAKTTERLIGKIVDE